MVPAAASAIYTVPSLFLIKCMYIIIVQYYNIVWDQNTAEFYRIQICGGVGAILFYSYSLFCAANCTKIPLCTGPHEYSFRL